MTIHVVGGCVWDERLVVDKLQSGESVPMRSHMQIGGVARNVAYALKNASKVELQCHFIRGDDASGHALDQELMHQGFEVAKVISGQSTARYMSIETKQGEVLHGLADMDLFDHFPTLNGLKGKALVLDTNPSRKYFETLDIDLPVYVVATSPHKIQRVNGLLHKITGLFLNRQEAIALVGQDLSLTDLALALAKQGPNMVMITQGAKQPVVYENGEASFADLPQPLPKNISHNGLGDRLTGLTLANLLSGIGLKQALNLSLKSLGKKP